MKKINNFLIKAFHLTNFVLIVFYLFPGSILGYLLYNNFSIQPQITQDFLISSNHFFVCLYHKYLSLKIEQLLDVFFGTEEQAETNRIDNTKKILFILFILFYHFIWDNNYYYTHNISK